MNKIENSGNEEKAAPKGERQWVFHEHVIDTATQRIVPVEEYMKEQIPRQALSMEPSVIVEEATPDNTPVKGAKRGPSGGSGMPTSASGHSSPTSSPSPSLRTSPADDVAILEEKLNSVSLSSEDPSASTTS